MGRQPAICYFKCDVCGEHYRMLDQHTCKKKKKGMSMKGYESYAEVTKNVLDSLQVGDLVKVNDWKKPMRIMGVSENYAVMIQKQFKDTYYSVIEKKPWVGDRHNAMIGGHFHCGKDDWIFGNPYGYKFDDAEAVAKYLTYFEVGETHLSVRNAIPILELHIKKDKQ